MTNKEARDKIIALKAKFEMAIKIYFGENAELDDCFEMAIKALEQEPCDKCVYSTKDGCCQYDDISETIPPFEPCDCISRAEAIKAVREAYSIYIPRMNGWEKGLPLKIDKAIYDLPSIQPKPKTDTWSIKGLVDVLEIIDKYKAESEE